MTAASLRTTGTGGEVFHVAVSRSKDCTKQADSLSGPRPPETYSVLPILVTVIRYDGIGRLGSLRECSVVLSCKSCSLLKICSGRG